MCCSVNLVGELGGSEGLVGLLQALEVLDSLHAELLGGVLIAHNHGVLVHLESGDSPHVVHSLLHALGEGEGLVSTVNDNDNLAGIQDGAHTHSKGGLGHLVHIVVEEAAVSNDGVVSLDIIHWVQYRQCIQRPTRVFTRVREEREEPGSLKAM